MNDLLYLAVFCACGLATWALIGLCARLTPPEIRSKP